MIFLSKNFNRFINNPRCTLCCQVWYFCYTFGQSIILRGEYTMQS